jgi:hypothetical protein
MSAALFIDFSDGSRLRVNGRAEVLDAGPLLALFPGSPRVVRVDVEQVVPNCAPTRSPTRSATGSPGRSRQLNGIP